jgi:hypothetical protein
MAVDPFDWLLVVSSADQRVDGALVMAKGEAKFVPAYMVHYWAQEQLNARFRRVLSTAVDAAFMAVGIGELASASRVVRAIALSDVVIQSGDIAVNIFEPEIVAQFGEEGRQFVSNYRKISLIAGFSTFGASLARGKLRALFEEEGPDVVAVASRHEEVLSSEVRAYMSHVEEVLDKIPVIRSKFKAAGATDQQIEALTDAFVGAMSDNAALTSQALTAKLADLLVGAGEGSSEIFSALGRWDTPTIDNFVDDLARGSDEFFDEFRARAELVRAWEVMYGSVSLRISINNLQYVSNYLNRYPNLIQAVKSNFDALLTVRQQSFINGIRNATLDPLDIPNARRALPDEISDAVNQIADHRIAVGDNSGNYGFLEGSVSLVGQIDNRMWRSGAANPSTEPQIFEAIIAEGSSGGSWLRNTDSEYKMLNRLAADLGGSTGNVYLSISGTLKIVSENPYCTSCQGVIQQFNMMFPNINLILVDRVK